MIVFGCDCSCESNPEKVYSWFQRLVFHQSEQKSACESTGVLEKYNVRVGHSNSKSTLHDWRYSDNIIIDCFTFVFFKLHMVWGMVSRKNDWFHKSLIWSCNYVSCCITISGISVEVLHSFQSSQVLGNFLLVAKGIELE